LNESRRINRKGIIASRCLFISTASFFFTTDTMADDQKPPSFVFTVTTVFPGFKAVTKPSAETFAIPGLTMFHTTPVFSALPGGITEANSFSVAPTTSVMVLGVNVIPFTDLSSLGGNNFLRFITPAPKYSAEPTLSALSESIAMTSS